MVEMLILSFQTAVIKETLRMAPATPGCLPRVVPSGGVYLGETFIPAGVREQAALFLCQASIMPYVPMLN